MKTIDALDRILGPLFAMIPPEVAEKIAAYRADAELQARLDELAEKSNEGLLSDEERKEYETYVTAINLVSILQSKAKTTLRQRVAG